MALCDELPPPYAELLRRRYVSVESGQQDSGKAREIQYVYTMARVNCHVECRLADDETDEALIQQHKLHQIPDPTHFDLMDIHNLLWSDAMGAGAMRGSDVNIYGHGDDPELHAIDLAGLCPRGKQDVFSQWISENAIHFFKCGLGRLNKANKQLGSNVYYDSTVLKVTGWITSIIASLLPIASILVLINVHTLKAKLFTVAAFDVLLSVCLTVFTDAKRSDVFAVTAAYVEPFHRMTLLTLVDSLLCRSFSLERMATPRVHNVNIVDILQLYPDARRLQELSDVSVYSYITSVCLLDSTNSSRPFGGELCLTTLLSLNSRGRQAENDRNNPSILKALAQGFRESDD